MIYITDTDFIPTQAASCGDFFKIMYFPLNPRFVNFERYTLNHLHYTNEYELDIPSRIIYDVLSHHKSATTRTAFARLYINELKKSIAILEKYNDGNHNVFIPFMLMNEPVAETILKYNEVLYVLCELIESKWDNWKEIKNGMQVIKNESAKEAIRKRKKEQPREGFIEEFKKHYPEFFTENEDSTKPKDEAYEQIENGTKDDSGDELLTAHDLSELFKYEELPMDTFDFFAKSLESLHEYYQKNNYLEEHKIGMGIILFKELLRRNNGYIPRNDKVLLFLQQEFNTYSGIPSDTDIFVEEIEYGIGLPSIKISSDSPEYDIITILRNPTDYYHEFFIENGQSSTFRQNISEELDFSEIKSPKGQPIKNITQRKLTLKELCFLFYCSLRSFNQTVNGIKVDNYDSMNTIKHQTYNICNCFYEDKKSQFKNNSTFNTYVFTRLKDTDFQTIEKVKSILQSNGMTYEDAWLDDLTQYTRANKGKNKQENQTE